MRLTREGPEANATPDSSPTMTRVSRSLAYESQDTHFELQVRSDPADGIGPALSISLRTRGFAGEDDVVPFEEQKVQTFLSQLAELDLDQEGEACLRSAAYTVAGEGTQLRCSSHGQGVLLVQVEMRRILRIGLGVEVLGLRAVFEVEGERGPLLVQDLRRLLSE